MNFYNYVTSGGIITIEDPSRRGDPAIFYCRDNKLLAACPAIGGDLEHLNNRPTRFNKHIDAMMTEGNIITAYPSGDPESIIKKVYNTWRTTNIYKLREEVKK